LKQTLSTDICPINRTPMADVGYHFANLWFAAEKQNWPLADYYLVRNALAFKMGRANPSGAKDQGRSRD